MADIDLAAMFDLPSPPRAARRARSRSRSASASPERGETSAAARQRARQESVRPAAAANGAASYRDHHPTISAAKSRQAALALLDDWTSGDVEAGAGAGAKRPIDDPLDFSAAVAADPDVKKRRVIPKIDSARLLSDEGLPALLQKARTFQVRGKGHEAKDLDNLLSMYQLWAHGMFPKATFKDTVARIEKVCHQRDMQSRMGQWKQEDRDRRARLLRGSPTPSPGLSRSLSPSDERSAQQHLGADDSGVAFALDDAVDEDMEAHAPADANGNAFEDMDEDALIAAAEADLALLLGGEEAAADPHPAPVYQNGTSAGAASRRERLFADPDEDDEDFAALEAMAEMEELDAMQP